MRFTILSLMVLSAVLISATSSAAQSKKGQSELEPLPMVPLALAPLLKEIEAEQMRAAQPSTVTPSVVTKPVTAYPLQPKPHADGELRIFDDTRDAGEDVKAAMKRARKARKNTMIIFGANWCHDSRALSGHFEGERFATLWDKDYEKVYVEVGQKDRNLDVARRYGLDGIVGTPSVLILDPRGKTLNADSAVHWRNSATLTEDAIFEYFDAFAREARKIR